MNWTKIEDMTETHRNACHIPDVLFWDDASHIYGSKLGWLDWGNPQGVNQQRIITHYMVINTP